MTQVGHIVIGLIVVIAAIYLFIFVTQRLTTRQVAKLMIKLQTLKDIPMQDRLVKGRKMSLMGQTLDDFQENEALYNRIVATDFDDVKQQADQVLASAQGFNIWQTNQDLRNLKKRVDQVARDIDTVNQGLTDLEQIDAEHKQAVQDLELKYKNLRKTLLSQNFIFGNTLDKLEDILGELEDEFSEFSNRTENGDHVAASEIYESLAMETNQLEERMDQIPGLVKDLSTTIPEQQEELQATFDQMMEQGFTFKDNFVEQALKQIEEDRKNTLEALKNLTLKKVQEQLTTLHQEINQIYKTFENEYQASQTVQKKLDELREYLGHLQQQNQNLNQLVGQLNQNYIFNHDEENSIRDLSRQLLQVEKDLDSIRLGINKKEVVFSQLTEKLMVDENQLDQVEEQQIGLWDSLKVLPEIVKTAQNKVELFVESMRKIKRRVERQGLPGAPTTYLNFFDQVSEMLNKLQQQVNAPRVNVDDLQRQVSIVGSDLDNLQVATNELLANATLTGILLHKANQYREYPEVVQAVQNAQVEYNQFYNYEKAVEVLGQALDRIEPGTTEILREQNNQNRLI
ncbi:septation ring formation regulator EzrA [Weissella koreensis KACC 15510]|uniref:septation ring formation regulator EzrA n=1 Tax=Weissella koreensis TaxID=165096 RepID=UPI0002174B2A|nr:septation ring formation regulator EzrA [Weissella koreensis]AEJ23856.1 septation ring formation regulator EzrA [Weissella koreensis KACC 15510]